MNKKVAYILTVSIVSQSVSFTLQCVAKLSEGSDVLNGKTVES